MFTRLLASLALLCLLACGCVTKPADLPNLSCVDSNLNIWRCGQPTTKGMNHLLAMGVTNAVKLNEEPEPTITGMTVYSAPITLTEQMTGVPHFKLQTALSWVTPGTVIHCEHGQDRTGLLVALYRLKEGWTRQAAREEMFAHGFHSELLGLWDAWEDWQ